MCISYEAPSPVLLIGKVNYLDTQRIVLRIAYSSSVTSKCIHYRDHFQGTVRFGYLIIGVSHCSREGHNKTKKHSQLFSRKIG